MPESQNIEWKESWRDEYLKWICGFANAKGGKIYIGKDDKGNVIGVPKFEKLMEDIPNKITNHLGIVANVNLLEESGKHYLEIEVPAYDVPISYHGKYHFRSGSTKQELSGNALNEFLLRKTGKTWDDVIEPNATLDDIDEKAIKAFKRGAIKSNRFIKRLTDNFELQKTTKKLEAFYQHDFKTLVAELKKQKINLSLVQQDEWEEYFTSYQKTINEIQQQITTTDNEIDKMVYELYELTEEEIAIVENS